MTIRKGNYTYFNISSLYIKEQFWDNDPTDYNVCIWMPGTIEIVISEYTTMENAQEMYEAILSAVPDSNGYINL